MTYVYICPDCGASQTVIHGMKDDPVITCTCGRVMHRKPQAFSVNWNGRKPSQGGVSPVISDLINSRPERLDHYNEVHK